MTYQSGVTKAGLSSVFDYLFIYLFLLTVSFKRYFLNDKFLVYVK